MNEFEALYRDYRHDISQFLFRLTGYQKELAEDLTQETFYRAILSFDRYRGNSTVKTWLCQIAKNVYFNSLRTTKKMKQVPLEENENHPSLVFDSPAAVYEKNELIGDAVKVMMQFDDNTRDVLVYRIFSELPYAQIGVLLQISESSAKVIFMRGKSKLQNRLREEYGYEI